MPETLKLQADVAADIEIAARILRAGGTVAFPTETVYGLGANALDRDAVARIFTAKQRPSWDPLIVHLASVDQLPTLTELNAETRARVAVLAEAFWPGPLTMLLPKSAAIPDEVTSGRALVGLRIPSHPAAQALIQATGFPLAAPSANTFGHTSPTTAQHVLDDLDTRINAVLDGGATTVGVESTVLDVSQTPMILYRPGAVSARQILKATGIEVAVYQAPVAARNEVPQSLPSPGLGIRHYAPRAKVILVSGGACDLRSALAAHNNAGALLPTGWTVQESVVTYPWGDWENPAELATNLFSGLRALDDKSVKAIICPLPAAGGMNDAIRDRLSKAAQGD